MMQMKVKLGDMFEIGSGGTPSKTHPEYYGGDIPWVKTGDLKSEYLYEVEDFITEEGLNNSSAKVYDTDTVLIAMYGATIGATSILKMSACTNQACAAFKKNEKVIPEYLYYFLKSQKEKFVRDGVGGAQPNISAGYLKKVEMELPSLEEQKVIVEILDKISEVVLKRNQEIQVLDDLIKARFVEMFGDIKNNTYGWKKYSLEQLTIKITDGEHGTVPRVNEGEGYLYFMARNITKEGLIDLSETSYVPVDVHQKIYKRCNPEAGDILLVCVGATVGKSALVTEKMGEFSMARSVALIKPDKEKINSLFLLNLLRSDAIQNNISNCVHAAAQAGLYTNMIKNLDAFVPPIELQNQFADFVKQVDKLKLQVQKSLDETQILFDSLMQQYFG